VVEAMTTIAGRGIQALATSRVMIVIDDARPQEATDGMATES